MTTTNICLDSLLHPICKDYGGCFSCDNIPKINIPKINFIVNQSPKSAEGTHFVCLVINKTEIYYFDSYGMKCYNEHILNYLKWLDRPVYYNNLPIQDMESKMCGYFCALVVMCNDTNYQNNITLKFDSVNLKENDKLCMAYLKRLILKS
jgi:hypothetical protein